MVFGAGRFIPGMTLYEVAKLVSRRRSLLQRQRYACGAAAGIVHRDALFWHLSKALMGQTQLGDAGNAKMPPSRNAPIVGKAFLIQPIELYEPNLLLGRGKAAEAAVILTRCFGGAHSRFHS